MSINLQDNYLNALRKQGTEIAIFLTNGIKLTGKINSFDQFVVLLDNSREKKGKPQLIYKHAISTLVPLTSIKFDPVI